MHSPQLLSTSAMTSQSHLLNPIGYVPALAYGSCRVSDQGTTLRASDLHNARATILNPFNICIGTWWRHQMETFSALLAICAGNSPVPGEFPAQRPVTRSFDVFFDLRLNKRLRKQSWGWWFETLSWPLWRHRNELSLKMQLWLVRRRLAAILVLKLMI